MNKKKDPKSSRLDFAYLVRVLVAAYSVYIMSEFRTYIFIPVDIYFKAGEYNY